MIEIAKVFVEYLIGALLVWVGAILGTWATFGIEDWMKEQKDILLASFFLALFWPAFLLLFVILWLKEVLGWPSEWTENEEEERRE